MTDWYGVEGPVLPEDMGGKFCPDRMAGVGRCEQDAGHEGRHKHGAVAWDEQGASFELLYGVDYTLGERTGPYPLAGLRQADAAQACGAVRVLGGANSEYLTCELWPEHEGSHVRVTDRHRFYVWSEEETEMPRDPYEKGGYTGGGSAAEMRPPARVPSAAHRPDRLRLRRSFPDNEVYLRTGPTVGRVENYSYGNGHLSAQLIIGGVEYLLALQVEEPGS